MADLPDFLKPKSHVPDFLAPPPQKADQQMDILEEADKQLYEQIRGMPESLQRFLRCLANTGKPILAAEMSGISTAIVYRARKINKTFRTLWESILDARADLKIEQLEDAAFERAVNGIRKGVYYKGAHVADEVVYSDGLLTTLLKAEDPEKYRERTQVDHSGEVHGGLNMLVVPAVQTVSDWSKNHGGKVIEHKPEGE